MKSYKLEDGNYIDDKSVIHSKDGKHESVYEAIENVVSVYNKTSEGICYKIGNLVIETIKKPINASEGDITLSYTPLDDMYFPATGTFQDGSIANYGNLHLSSNSKTASFKFSGAVTFGFAIIIYMTKDK